jgi:hypothetical protein
MAGRTLARSSGLGRGDQQGLKLFANEVLPVLKTWNTQETAHAAE